jgi:hypothetical protein
MSVRPVHSLRILKGLLTQIILGRWTLSSIAESRKSDIGREEGWREELDRVDIWESTGNRFRVLPKRNMVISICNSAGQRGETEKRSKGD